MEINISVIIPCYNRERTIERCIKSIINQTVKPYEIIIVDDGSTDGSVEKIEQLDCNFLRLIKQNHKGAQAARNLGILNAKGNYIAFLDSDDEWLPNMLEKEVGEIIRAQGKSVVYSDCFVVNGRKKKIWKLPGHSGEMYKFLLQFPGPMFQSMIAKKDFFINIGLLDEDVVAYQEWDTAIRLAKKHQFVHIKEPLFLYHMHDDETISKDIRKSTLGYEYIIQKNRDEIISNVGIGALVRHYKYLVKIAWQYEIQYFIRCVINFVSTMIYYFAKKLAKVR